MIKSMLINAGLLLMACTLLWPTAHADRYHEHQATYITENTYDVNEVVDGKAIAFAQAGANNHISATTFKPQLSLGIGAYESDMAASIMFGQKACKDCLLFSGSFAFDGDFEEKAIGFGMTFTFK